MSGFERIVNIRPAYDCMMIQPCVHGSEDCKPGSGGSHGRHNAEMHMILRGESTEITLALNTGWELPETPKTMRLNGRESRGICVEFHSAAPWYEGQEPRGGSCHLWPVCYWDAGYGMSDEPAELLVRKGSEAVWEWLAVKHQEMFTASEASL